MEASHHMAAVRELDLSACHPNSIVDRINAVPGLKTSTAFFTFLRANLVLPSSAMSSNVSTPLLEPASSLTLQPPSPSPLATSNSREPSSATSTATASGQPPLPSLDDIPPLSLTVLTRREDKVDALKLVADSIAQQRQQASLGLVFHPLNLAGLVVALAAAYQINRHQDAGTLIAVLSGVIMAYLMVIRYVTSSYLNLAEELKWDWLLDANGDEDTVIGTRFGREMIGALVLRLEPAGGAAGGGSSGSNPHSQPASRRKGGRGGNSDRAYLKGGRGVIRAWTTRLRFRGRGVGADMLHEAVRVTRERCGRDAEVGFAAEHANSTMILPELYNAPFRKSEMRAARALEAVLGEWDGNKRKR